MIYYILFSIIGIIIGGGGTFIFYRKDFDQVKKDKEEIRNRSNKIIEDAEKKGKEIINNSNMEANRKQQKIDQFEERLLQKEEKIDKKLETLEQEKDNLKAKQEELKQTINEQKTKLEQIGGLSQDEAKKKIFEIVEKEQQEEISKFIQKFKQIKEEEAETIAGQIISTAMPKAGVDIVSEFTVSDVVIPSEDTKGKIIGREGRNISYFEKITGVELIIDDTPMTVRISAFDPEKRFLATETLRRLMKDGRINPVYIEKTYEEVSNSINALFKKKGEETLSALNLPMVNPEVLTLLGKFHLRYSYGQNLLIHSVEVAKLSEILANELGLDGTLAKKAGLLHDIGKVVDSNLKAHAKVGAETLKKYGFNDVIVNAAESHHGDEPCRHAISHIVAAADAISASRPGARLNTKDLFIERMETLEKLILGIEGVDKTYIMQAGREIMTFVNPEKVSDLDLEKIVKNVGKTIESQLDYPGVIRVVAVRENKFVDYLN